MAASERARPGRPGHPDSDRTRTQPCCERGLISKYCHCPVVARLLTCAVTVQCDTRDHQRHLSSHGENNMVSMQAGMRADPMVSVTIAHDNAAVRLK